MAESIAFMVNGNRFTLTQQDVVAAMAGVQAEPVRSHSVRVGGVWYPVKQVFGRVTKLDRLDFTSAVARRNLARLGFELQRA
jgi:hypothetical protein